MRRVVGLLAVLCSVSLALAAHAAETKVLYVANELSPGHVILMHLPREPEKIERLERRLSEKFPAAIVFREQLQLRTF
jgi:hypothetical protein